MLTCPFETCYGKTYPTQLLLRYHLERDHDTTHPATEFISRVAERRWLQDPRFACMRELVMAYAATMSFRMGRHAKCLEWVNDVVMMEEGPPDDDTATSLLRRASRDLPIVHRYAVHGVPIPRYVVATLDAAARMDEGGDSDAAQAAVATFERESRDHPIACIPYITASRLSPVVLMGIAARIVSAMDNGSTTLLSVIALTLDQRIVRVATLTAWLQLQPREFGALALRCAATVMWNTPGSVLFGAVVVRRRHDVAQPVFEAWDSRRGVYVRVSEKVFRERTFALAVDSVVESIACYLRGNARDDDAYEEYCLVRGSVKSSEAAVASVVGDDDDRKRRLHHVILAKEQTRRFQCALEHCRCHRAEFQGLQDEMLLVAPTTMGDDESNRSID